jgi:hypothetical protein
MYLGRRLRRKGQIKFLQEKGDVGARLGVPDQEQFSAFDGGDAHIEHLDGGEFSQNHSRRQSRDNASGSILRGDQFLEPHVPWPRRLTARRRATG